MRQLTAPFSKEDLILAYDLLRQDFSRQVLIRNTGGGLALAAALRAPRRLGGVLMLSSWVAEPLPDDFKDCCSRPGVESYMLIQ
ncbi:Lypla2 [Symbiodinium necroappetens]|uniref:Lypla2 protein n=1 Tax=Symbiodinium necroappetens TaxID=1628268 RepID=A0A812YXN6_9DINO|nr:Lypla2 [Symbiodinium necroappetens]